MALVDGLDAGRPSEIRDHAYLPKVVSFVQDSNGLEIVLPDPLLLLGAHGLLLSKLLPCRDRVHSDEDFHDPFRDEKDVFSPSTLFYHVFVYQKEAWLHSSEEKH